MVDEVTATLIEQLQVTDGMVREVLSELRQNRNSAITITHRQEDKGNAGFYGGVATTCCVATLTLMIAFMIIENRSYAHLDNQVDQLKAWNDINRAKIAALEAKAKP